MDETTIFVCFPVNNPDNSWVAYYDSASEGVGTVSWDPLTSDNEIDVVIGDCCEIGSGPATIGIPRNIMAAYREFVAQKRANDKTSPALNVSQYDGPDSEKWKVTLYHITAKTERGKRLRYLGGHHDGFLVYGGRYRDVPMNV